MLSGPAPAAVGADAVREETFLSASFSALLSISIEQEVLRLIVEGKNVKEIGGILGISTKTAESHRTNIMEKLNIHEIVGLIRYAIREGIVGPP